MLMANHVKPGDVYGRLTVLERRGNQKFLCKCSCGATKIVRWRTAVSCGCARSESSRRKRLPPGVAAFRDLFKRYVLAAKCRNLVFELTSDQFAVLTAAPCHYCDSPPSTSAGSMRVFGKYVYNGVDRKDNTVGYTTENCVPCCKICNRAKGTLSYEEFTKWIQFIRGG